MKNLRSLCLAGLLVCGLALPGCGRKKKPEAAPPAEAATEEESGPYAGVPAVETVTSDVIEPATTPLPLADRPAVDPAAMPAGGDIDFAEYEAWFKKHNLDLNDPAMLDADPDGDGHSNRDEFLASTDPHDAASFPGLHPTLRMTEYAESTVPVVLEEVSRGQAKIRHSSGTEQTVKVGDTIKGTAYKVVRFAAVEDTDKQGATLDISRLVLEDADSGARVTLVKDLPARSAESYALLDAGGEKLKVRQGEEFSLPGEPDRKYQVLDIRPAQVVVKEVGADAVWTIPKAATE